MALNKTLLNELSILMGEKIGTGRESLSNINVSTYEMQETYKEEEPYAIAKTLIGDRYIWTESFINKVLYSLSTDDLSDMNASEYRVMMGFINFQNRHSTVNTSAQISAGAVGCTAKNEAGISYAVFTNGISNQKCADPYFDVPRDSVYKSLDNVLIYILNCEDWRTKDVLSGTLIDVSLCEI